MKIARYAVVPAEAGFVVREVCPRWYALGRCAFERWCTCVHLDGGPCSSVVGVFQSLDVALEVAETFEAELGGVRDVDAGCVVVGAEAPDWASDVPF